MYYPVVESGTDFDGRNHELSRKEFVLLGAFLGAFGLLLVVSLGLTRSLIDLVPQALVALALLGTAGLSLRAAFPAESPVSPAPRQTPAALARAQEMSA